MKNPKIVVCHRSILADLKAVTTALCVLVIMLLMLILAPGAWAVDLKPGDILVVDAFGNLIVVDATTGAQTVVSSGNNFVTPHNLALEANGKILVVDRISGIIRVNPADGSQTIVSSAGIFKDPFAITVDGTGNIFIADSGYNPNTNINEAGKIIQVNPSTGQQFVIATANPCGSIPVDGSACLNTTTAGLYLTHPYGVDVDANGMLIVADKSSFNGQGAIIRIDPVTGFQTLLWGPAAGSPQVSQSDGFACPLNVTIEADGNILASTVQALPEPPATNRYGCGKSGIFRVNLASSTQQTLSANPPVGWRVPFGLDTEANGNVIVVDEGWSAIYRLDTAGQFIGPVPFSEGLGAPFGVAVVKPAGGSTTATTVSVAAATGTYSGTVNLSATLTQTSGGAAVNGKSISFTLNGSSVGSTLTNSSGVATLSGVSLAGINAGTYATGVGASFAGGSNFGPSTGSANLTVNQASSTTTVTVINATFDGNPHGGTAAVTGAGGLNQSLTVSYSGRNGTTYGPSTTAPTNVGDYTASASFAGDANHTGSSDNKNYSISNGQSSSVTTVTVSDAVYDGNPHGGTAVVTGSGGLNQSLTVSYSGRNGTTYGPSTTAPTNAGDYTASASFAGDATHTGSSNNKNFRIAKAGSVTTVTVSDAVYDGHPHGGTAVVTGAGGLNQSLPLTYTGTGGTIYGPSGTPPTNVGNYTAAATYSGDNNHNSSSNSKNFAIKTPLGSLVCGLLPLLCK